MFLLCILSFVLAAFTLLLVGHRLALHVNLTLKKLVEALENLLLTLGNDELLLIEPYSVRLTAGLQKVPLVVVCAASSPASVHQFLVVAHWHLLRSDAPRFVTFDAWLVLVLAVAAFI